MNTTRLHRALYLCLGTLAALASAGCLEPLVEDEVERPSLILEAGSELPSAEESEAVSAQIDANDGVPGDVVPLIAAFRDGEPIFYYDFGPAPEEVQPLEMLVRDDPEGRFEVDGRKLEPIGHPPVWRVVPGDPAYSPFWLVRLVPVTDAYDGELLGSFDAIEEARRVGLVEDALVTELVVNCPVVPSNVMLPMPDGTMKAPSVAYYEGWRVWYHDVGIVEMIDESRVGTGNRYLLRREGGEPLNEPWRGVDLTGDGDIADTNDLFGDFDGNALRRAVELVVSSESISIDSGGDPVEFDDLSMLLDPDGSPKVGVVLGMRTLDLEVCNCPIAQ